MGSKRTRMYVHEDFKHLIELRRIENREHDGVKFTKQIVDNPKLLFKETKKNDRKKKTLPSLF